MIESPISYARYAVGNRERVQMVALRESTFSYARQTVRNRNRGQVVAITESIISYARHSIFYYYFLDTFSLGIPRS